MIPDIGVCNTKGQRQGINGIMNRASLCGINESSTNPLITVTANTMLLGAFVFQYKLAHLK